MGLLRGFGLWLRTSGYGLRASGYGLRASGFGALGLHGFGIEVASCVYSGNGGNDIGYIIFLLRLYFQRGCMIFLTTFTTITTVIFFF